MAKTTVDTGTVRDTLHVYWRAAREYKSKLFLALLLPVGAIFTSVALPFLAGKILAGIMQESPAINTYLTLFAVCSILAIAANRFGMASSVVLQARGMSHLNHLVFERLLSRSIGFHANRVSGKLVSDATDFITSFAELVNTVFRSVLTFAATIVIGLVVLFANSWPLGIFVGLVVVTIIAWAGMDSYRRSKLKVKRLAATKKLVSHLSDGIVNAQTVKTFAQEGIELNRNKQLNARLEDMRVRDWQQAGHSGTNRLAFLLAMQFCMIVFVIHLTRANPEVLATGIFAFTYTLMLTNRLFEINTMIRNIEEYFLRAAPMTSVLREVVEIQDAPEATTLTVPHGRIALQNISFAYPDNAKNGAVFHSFNLAVSPGEKVGLVGPSGGGKSTLTRLLLRFDEVQQGEVLVDGQNINYVTQQSLRKAIAYVPQEPLLFHRSIRENIAYSRPDASNEEIVAAAKRANAHDFIDKLPEGYDTVVGERGVKLSGGQRQRIAIARAILKDAPILILDEATSALDSENEIQVQEALWHLMQGRTAIVIAHRLSTIQKMDRIVVLAGGKIEEEGTHKQLIKNKALYAKLWHHQSGGFIEE